MVRIVQCAITLDPIWHGSVRKAENAKTAALCKPTSIMVRPTTSVSIKNTADWDPKLRTV